MVGSYEVTPSVVGIGDKLRSRLVIYRYNVTLYILLIPEDIPYVLSVSCSVVLHTYRCALGIVKVNCYVSVSLFTEYLRAVEIVGRGYAVLRLRGSYSRFVVCEGVFIRANGGTRETFSRPNEAILCAVVVA